MDGYFYFSSIRNTTVQVIDLFNSITIGKYNKNGDKVKEIKVPLKYAMKEKFYYWINDKKGIKHLPMMSLQMTSIDYDESRKGDSHYTFTKIKTTTENNNISINGSYKIPAPAPYTIGYQLNVACEHMIELDQILEQIFPFFNPFVMIRIRMEDVLDISFDAKVTYQGMSLDLSSDIGEEDQRLINCTLDFNVHTYMFKPINDVKLIETINAPIYLSEGKGSVPLTETLKLTEIENSNQTKKFIGGNPLDKPIEIESIEGKLGKDVNDIIVKFEIYEE